MAKKPEFNQWSLALLRAVLGVIFIYHGYTKLFVIGGLPGTLAYFQGLGLPYPNYSAVIVAFAEFLGGLFLFFGVVTRWTTLVLIFEMLVAFFVVHLRSGFVVSKNGYEFVLLILAGLAVILLNGAGELSLGKKLKNKHLK